MFQLLAISLVCEVRLFLVLTKLNRTRWTFDVMVYINERKWDILQFLAIASYFLFWLVDRNKKPRAKGIPILGHENSINSWIDDVK